VPSGNGFACLVRGPIMQVKFAVMLGVAGSWVEIHGEDRRVEMNRVCIQAAWRGLASTAASQILTAYGFNPEVEPTTKLYSDADHTLNQRGTDLDFLEQIARETGYELWLEYDIKSPASTQATPIEIDEPAKLLASPRRQAHAVLEHRRLRVRVAGQARRSLGRGGLVCRGDREHYRAHARRRAEVARRGAGRRHRHGAVRTLPGEGGDSRHQCRRPFHG